MRRSRFMYRVPRLTERGRTARIAADADVSQCRRLEACCSDDLFTGPGEPDGHLPRGPVGPRVGEPRRLTRSKQLLCDRILQKRYITLSCGHDFLPEATEKVALSHRLTRRHAVPIGDRARPGEPPR